MRLPWPKTVLVAVAVLLVATPLMASLFRHETKPTRSPVIGVYAAKAQTRNMPITVKAVGHIKAIRSVSLSFSVAGTITHIFIHHGRVKKGDVIAALNDDAAQAQLQSLQAKLDETQSTYQRYLQLKTLGDVSSEVLEQQKANYLIAKAAVKQQQVLLSDMKITAPFSGVLGTYAVSEGAYVTAGQTIVPLVQEAPLKVVYSIPATQRSKIEIGQNLIVHSSSYPSKTFKGIVSFIAPSVNQSTGTLTIEAKVNNPDYLLLPGMFVTLSQVVQGTNHLLAVPDVAFLTDIRGQFIYVVAHGEVHKRHVKIGRIVNGWASIKSGLKAGEWVVIAGQQKLNEGDRVKILPTPKDAPAAPTHSKTGSKKSSALPQDRTHQKAG